MKQRSSDSFPILDELRKKAQYKLNGCPPYSAEVIRYSLLLRYTYPQAYKFLQEKFLLPSFSLLQRLHRSDVDSVKTARMLLKERSSSRDAVLMADETYLQQTTELQGGDCVGEGQHYKDVIVFFYCGLEEFCSHRCKSFS